MVGTIKLDELALWLSTSALFYFFLAKYYLSNHCSVNNGILSSSETTLIGSMERGLLYLSGLVLAYLR